MERVSYSLKLGDVLMKQNDSVLPSIELSNKPLISNPTRSTPSALW